MGTLALLDLILGLSFVYLLLALVCTTVMEWVAQVRNLRGQGLETGIRRLLGEEKKATAPLTAEFFGHPLLQALSADDKKPSYVPAKLFATALRDLLKQPRLTEVAAPELKQSLAALAKVDPQPDATDQLPSEAALGQWFDQGMERASGAYKRRTRRIVLGLAFVVAIALNADTVSLTGRLWQNPTLRAYLVERAKIGLDAWAMTLPRWPDSPPGRPREPKR